MARGTAAAAATGAARLAADGLGAVFDGPPLGDILLEAGIGDIAVGDSVGIISSSREDLTPVKAALAARTNRLDIEGSIEEAMAGADVFIGLSAGKVSDEAVASMAPDAIVFALANPDPEIHPEVAMRTAAVVATGASSDRPCTVPVLTALVDTVFPAGAEAALAATTGSASCWPRMPPTAALPPQNSVRVFLRCRAAMPTAAAPSTTSRSSR